MFLTSEELIELTGRTRKDAQIRVLRFMMIEHRARPNGSVAVLRTHVERMLCGQIAERGKKGIEPNWGAI